VKFRKATWGLIIWTGLMALWAFSGAMNASSSCADATYGTACAAGAGIGIMLLGGLWFMGFIVGSVIWFASKPKV
jgi:hypothetical protein